MNHLQRERQKIIDAHKTIESERILIGICCKYCCFYDDDYKRCNRYPPIILLNKDEPCGYIQVLPTVHKSNWCGEFKQKEIENKE